MWTRKISSKLLKLANPYISDVTSNIIDQKVVPAILKKSREYFIRKNSNSLRGRVVDLIDGEVRGRPPARVGYK